MSETFLLSKTISPLLVQRTQQKEIRSWTTGMIETVEKRSFVIIMKRQCKKLQDVQNLGFIVFKKFDARQEDTALY